MFIQFCIWAVMPVPGSSTVDEARSDFWKNQPVIQCFVTQRFWTRSSGKWSWLVCLTADTAALFHVALYVMCSEQLREERFNTCHFINRNISHDCVDEHELGMSQKGLWKLSNYHRLGRRLLFRDIKGTGWCTAVSTPLSLMDTKDINNWQTLQTDWLSSSDEVVFMAFINRNFLNNLWTNISGKKNSCTNHFTEKTLKKTSPLLLIHSSSTSSLTPTKRFVINQPESQELDGKCHKTLH